MIQSVAAAIALVGMLSQAPLPLAPALAYRPGLPAGRPALNTVAAPRLTVQLSPSTPRPGDVLIVRATVAGAVQMDGRLGELPVRFAPADPSDVSPVDAAGSGSNFIALVGLDGMLKPGPYILTINAVAADGSVSQDTKTITVQPARYVLESVKLGKELAVTLDPQINAAEAQEVLGLYQGFSPEKWWAGPLHWPITGKLAAVYGNRRAYNGINLGTYHSGIDIVAGRGVTVEAAAPGRVVAVKPYVVRGLTIIMDHGRGVFTSYDHLSLALVAPGQMVNVGDPIGKVGTTGRSQGPHLHFELAVGGAPVDPLYWLKVALP